MMTRRLFTQIFAGAFAWFTGHSSSSAHAAVETPASNDVGGTYRPTWCPQGWLPLMGQTITAEEYPDMFVSNTPLRPGGKRMFLPEFFGKTSARLEQCTPIERSMLDQSGWVDNLTHVGRAPDNKVRVLVIAVSHQRSSSGHIFHAGFTMGILVDRDEFEKDYGPVLPNQPGSGGMFYSGYEAPVGNISDSDRARFYAAEEAEAAAQKKAVT